MAAVLPVTSNKCVGNYADGLPNRNLYCNKGVDDNGDAIYTCATWRMFKANCPKGSLQCSNNSSAWVPAITICNQRLF